MTTAIAPTLGVNWMTNLLSADVGGPTVAYNPTFGRTVVYSGDERGEISAIDEATGLPLWSSSVGVDDSIYSTPLISSDQSSVWFGTAYAPTLYKVNTANGAVECSMKEVLPIQASPTEGLGSNGNPQVYVSTIDGPGHWGPQLAFNEATCAKVFSVTPYKTPYSGAWASDSYGVDAKGRRLIFEGTADPDSSEYAIDATTGALDWYFVTDQSGDHDIGAASTTSPVGNNGFADGVVYTIDKNEVLYANDLTTGKPIWQYNFGQDAGTPQGSARSTAALDGNTLVFGMANGVYAVNATTGAKRWHYIDPLKLEVISSPAIVGPPGAEVVAFADISGNFQVLSLATGALLYSYQTGNYITASPSYANGHFLITSADGFLYDFAANGGNGGHPRTAIVSPAQGQTLPYAGTITLSGTATDATGVASVQVAVQMGGSSGQWYNAATSSWSSGALINSVPVANPGATSTSWSMQVPVPTSGTTLQVYANAVNVSHLADVSGTQVGFAVAASTATPQLTASATYIAPGAQFQATGTAFGASEVVDFTVSGTLIGTAKTNKAGVVSATLTLPTSTLFGVTPLTATGTKSGKTAFTPIDVANAWLQAGDNPAHTAFEPNDSILQKVVSPGGNEFLALSWYFMAGAPVESSPSVYDGAVYFGNDAGTLTAIGTDTSAPLWTLNLPDDAPIRSTPAIDPSTGLVTITADDGTVLTANAVTGVQAGSVSVGGLPTSPTVFNGTIYVGSDNGTLTSINETTGATNWSQTLGGAIHAVPSLDTSTGVLVVGDDDGAISAFNAKTGGELWQVQTGGPVTAAPTIANGVIYVGSTDGNVYAVGEATGSSVWTLKIGSAIATGAPYDPNLKLVYAGAANGIMYALNASNGAIAWTTYSPFVKSAYSGVSAVNAFILANETAGALEAYHSSQFGRFNSNHKTASTLTTAPAINDGTVYVGAADGGVYAFTPFGGLPQIVPASIRRADAARAATRSRVIWPTQRRLRGRFAWIGRRDVGIHVDAVIHGRPTAPTAITAHGGPIQNAPRSYAIFWQSARSRLERRYVPGIAAGLRAAGRNPLAGVYLDSTAPGAVVSDAALQAEVLRAITVNHWPAGINSQFLVFTASQLIAPGAGYCAYHSALMIPAQRSFAPYAVIPYSGALGACGTPATLTRTGDPAIDTATANALRVQAEMATDPLLNAWHADGGEELHPSP